MKSKHHSLVRIAAVMALLGLSVPQATAFTYQGVLSQNGSPAQGPHEMTFQLLLSGTATTVGSPITLPVDVSNGLFAANIPFDPLLFDGTEYELEISVRAGVGPIYVLSPPTQLTAAPQALFADSVGSVPDVALSGNVPRLDQPTVFLTSVSMPLARLSDAGGGGRIVFGGPTDDCSVAVDPTGPSGLLLGDPGGIRILSPNPLSPPVLRFGPTDDCSIGLDPVLPGLVERDPIGFRLLGQNNEGCRLIFGPTMDCTVEISPPGPGSIPGLLLRDPSGIRILPTDPTVAPKLIFGPTQDCRLQTDPSGTLTGLIAYEPNGVRLIDEAAAAPRLIFGPTDDCTIGIDPTRQGLRVAENYGLRLHGSSGQGCRLIFGPTDECTVEISPPGPGSIPGLLLRDPSGIRVLPTDPLVAPKLIFGPTDDCRLQTDPTGTIPGLIAYEQDGFRLIDEVAAAPRLIFGPTDDCTIGIDPTRQGLRVAENYGLRLHGSSGQGCRLIFGPTDECTVEISPPGPGSIPGLLLRDPSGIRILPTDPTVAPKLIFGPTQDCRLATDPSVGGLTGLIAYEPNGLRLIDEVSSEPSLKFGPTDDCSILLADDGTGAGRRLTLQDATGVLVTNDVEVQGAVTANAFNQTSTRRLKENIQPIENPIGLLEQLQGVRYDWKAEQGGKADIGFIAEEVGKVFPEIVSWEEDGINARGLNYGHLVAVAVEGIKAQQTEIETLRQEKVDMEIRLARLETLLLNNTQPEVK